MVNNKVGNTSHKKRCDMEDKKKDYDKCLRCGRKLKSEEARKIGYGRTCFIKIKSEMKVKRLF